MKKIFMTMAAVVVAMTASAQVYVGGSFGVGSVEDNDFSYTNYSFVPEVGYNLDENWAIGTTIGWEGASKGGAKAFTVSPYVRYTFLQSKLVNVFVDGGFGYSHLYGNQRDADMLSVGVKPGVAVNLSDKLSFVTHVGFLGYTHQKDHNTDRKIDSWGLNLDGNNIMFGLYYNF